MMTDQIPLELPPLLNGEVAMMPHLVNGEAAQQVGDLLQGGNISWIFNLFGDSEVFAFELPWF